MLIFEIRYSVGANRSQYLESNIQNSSAEIQIYDKNATYYYDYNEDVYYLPTANISNLNITEFVKSNNVSITSCHCNRNQIWNGSSCSTGNSLIYYLLEYELYSVVAVATDYIPNYSITHIKCSRSQKKIKIANLTLEASGDGIDFHSGLRFHQQTFCINHYNHNGRIVYDAMVCLDEEMFGIPSCCDSRQKLILNTRTCVNDSKNDLNIKLTVSSKYDSSNVTQSSMNNISNVYINYNNEHKISTNYGININYNTGPTVFVGRTKVFNNNFIFLSNNSHHCAKDSQWIFTLTDPSNVELHVTSSDFSPLMLKVTNDFNSVPDFYNKFEFCVTEVVQDQKNESDDEVQQRFNLQSNFGKTVLQKEFMVLINSNCPPFSSISFPSLSHPTSFSTTPSNSSDWCEKHLKLILVPLVALSSLFLTLSLVLHSMTPDRKKKVASRITACHIVSLLAGFLALLTQMPLKAPISEQTTQQNSTIQDLTFYYNHSRQEQIPSPFKIICKTIGPVIQISFLAAFFWLNVMCFDIWWILRCRSPTGESAESAGRRFMFYCIYAWGVPLLMGGVTLLMDNLQLSPDIVVPGFGNKHCWFETWHANLVYFYGVTGLLLVVNVCLFMWVVIILLQAHFTYGQIVRRTSSASKKRLWVYLKTFAMMGISWVFEVVSFHEGTCHYWAVTDIINSLRGVIIFFIVFGNRNAVQKLRQLLSDSSQRIRQQVSLSFLSSRQRKETKTTSFRVESSTFPEPRRSSFPLPTDGQISSKTSATSLPESIVEAKVSVVSFPHEIDISDNPELSKNKNNSSSIASNSESKGVSKGIIKNVPRSYSDLNNEIMSTSYYKTDEYSKNNNNGKILSCISANKETNNSNFNIVIQPDPEDKQGTKISINNSKDSNTNENIVKFFSNSNYSHDHMNIESNLDEKESLKEDDGLEVKAMDLNMSLFSYYESNSEFQREKRKRKISLFSFHGRDSSQKREVRCYSVKFNHHKSKADLV